MKYVKRHRADLTNNPFVTPQSIAHDKAWAKRKRMTWWAEVRFNCWVIAALSLIFILTGAS